MTFMNAKIDFWCGRPQHLAHLSPQEWRELSGQHQSGGGPCQVYDLDYQAHSEKGLRCGRPATTDSYTLPYFAPPIRYTIPQLLPWTSPFPLPPT